MEQRNLEWKRDVRLIHTDSGDGLLYTNMYCKNYQGGLNHKHVKAKEVKAFPNKEHPERCFVMLYKEHAERRLHITNTSYYLKPMDNFTDKKWYCNSPVGHNILSKMVKNICEMGGLCGGNFVNKKNYWYTFKKTPRKSEESTDW